MAQVLQDRLKLHLGQFRAEKETETDSGAGAIRREDLNEIYQFPTARPMLWRVKLARLRILSVQR